MKKKIMICALALALLSGLAACKTTQTGNQEDGLTQISLLFSENGTAPYKSDWMVLKEFEERKNVKLNLQVVPSSDYATKRSVVFASGDIPDLLSNTWPNEVSQYASEGILLPVSDYVDQLPNLKNIMETWDLEDTIKDISERDGKFYVFPGFRKTNVNTQSFHIRQDAFEEAGIPIPTTYDELADALLQLKDKYPDSLGLGDMYNGDFLLSFVASSFNTKGGWSLPNGYSYHPETDEWYFAPTSEEYKTMLQYLNKLYVNGCLDPEGFTQDANQFDQKVLTGKYLVFPGGDMGEAITRTEKIIAAGTPDAKVTAILPLAGPTGLAKTKPGSKSGEGVGMPASCAEREDFDKVLDFCDWLYYSEEAAILTNCGVEGEQFDMVDGQLVYKDNIQTALNPTGELVKDRDFGIGQMGMRSLATDILPDEIRYAGTAPEVLEFKQQLIDMDAGVQDDPILKMTPQQLERSKMLITTLNDYTGTMILKFIYGQESFDNWDAYVQECENKGAKELIEIVEEAWRA